MILLTAAEASGDVLGGALLDTWLRQEASHRFVGFAGPAMVRAGGKQLQSLGSTDQLSAAGGLEVLPALPKILAARRRVRRRLRRDLQAAVFIDAPDLHLPLCRLARARGLPTALLVAPQFWAWRRGRARVLREAVDRVLCLFPFEVPLLARQGVDARWVGHPAVDAVLARPPVGPGPRPQGTGPLRLALLPGSRWPQARAHLPLFAAAARLAFGAEVELRVPWRFSKPTSKVEGLILDPRPGLDVLAEADLALCAPGTASLEAALLGIPQVCALRMAASSWALARRLVRVRFAAMPNLLLDEEVVPEFLQPRSPNQIAQALLAFREDPQHHFGRAQETRLRLLELLGPAGFGERATQALDTLLAEGQQ